MSDASWSVDDVGSRIAWTCLDISSSYEFRIPILAVHRHHVIMRCTMFRQVGWVDSVEAINERLVEATQNHVPKERIGGPTSSISQKVED
jgi:hypothetical protein